MCPQAANTVPATLIFPYPRALGTLFLILQRKKLKLREGILAQDPIAAQGVEKRPHSLHCAQYFFHSILGLSYLLLADNPRLTNKKKPMDKKTEQRRRPLSLAAQVLPSSERPLPLTSPTAAQAFQMLPGAMPKFKAILISG